METKKLWYAKSKTELFAYFDAGPQGLQNSEVIKRQKHFGKNILPTAKPESVFTLFIRQFQNPLIYLLLAAAGTVAAMGEYSDGSIIAAVLLINATIGALQEGRAARTLASLQKLVTTNATVIRNNEELVVLDEELVPGDIIVLREGEKVPADCRIVDQASVRVNESSLTGESVSQEKHAQTIPTTTPLPTTDQKNMLFRGTLITSGNCKALVVATGINTILGSITGQVTQIHHEIPLQKNIRHLANILIVVVALISLTLFSFGLWNGMQIRELFSIVVSLAVSIIPEGLPIAVTLILVSGVYRMSKRNALVKKLQAIEALGQVSVIAVDKTGTLTKNEMTVTEVVIGNSHFMFSGNGYTEQGEVTLEDIQTTTTSHPELASAAVVFALCGNARITHDQVTNAVQIAGDPTDAALVVAARKLGVDRDDLLARYPLVEELPFDYKRKFHATVYEIEGSNFMSAVGAVESILPLCPDAQTRSVLLQARNASKKGLRVLAFAYSKKVKASGTELPKLTFGGLVYMTDPLLPGIAESTELLRSAGISVVMITGDNAVTAKAIAQEAGIFREQSLVLTSQELHKLSGAALSEKLENVSVFARVTPEDKLWLVQQYGKAGKIIAMTGDGVNDAPALLGADIGMAMGDGGTEVAKESADIVLLDNNFKTIVAAVEEGRNIYLVIRKVLLFLFSTSLGGLFTISASVLFGLPLPILAVHILWLNFFTDGALTMALGLEPKANTELTTSFSKPSRYLIDKSLLFRTAWLGSVMAVVTTYVFMHTSGELIYRQTIALTLLAVLQWCNAWNTRSERSLLLSKPWKNPWLLLATAFAALLQLAALYWTPLQNILKTTPISLADWQSILLWATSIFFADELYKLLRRLFTRPSRVH